MRFESYVPDYHWDLLDRESSDEVVLAKSKLVK